MPHARRAGPHQKWPIVLTGTVVAAVLVAGGLLVGGAVMLGRIADDDSARPSETVVRNSGGGAPGPSEAAAVTPSADPTTACRAEIAAAEAVVAATRTAATHWRQHVQARTDLLAHRVTLDRTKAIWKATRLAGPADVQRVASADTAFALVRGGCARLPGSACKTRLTALAEASRTGHAATRDWQHHQAMMVSHKAGEFDAEHAQSLWVTAWKTAPKNLNAFATASATLAQAPVCHP